MSAFAVDLQALQDAIGRMAGFESLLEGGLDEVDARARSLQSSWSGAAAGEYAVAHRQWLGGARDMHAALGQMRRIAAIAQENYAAAIEANTAMWP